MKRIVFTLLAFCMCASSAIAADLSTELQPRIGSHSGMGIIVAVVDGKKTTLYKVGSTGNGTKLDQNTVFEIGSVSKTFTATILSDLSLRHVVSLDDPVSKYLHAAVQVPTRGGKVITLVNLATQHSGLPRMPDNMHPKRTDDPYAGYMPADMYAFLSGYKLDRDPGAEYEYSNFAVGLLGQALANSRKTGYARLLATEITGPLGMRDTAIVLPSSMQSRFAAGHDQDGNVVHSWHLDAFAPAGGIRSTMSDMLKYLRCNMGSGPLANACIHAQKPRAALPGGSRIGLIWMTDPQGTIWHNGATGGYRSIVAISADHKRGVIALSNGAPVDDIAWHVLDPKRPLAQFENAATAQLPRAQLPEYEGVFDVIVRGKTVSMTVANDGKNLTAQLSGQSALRIYPALKDQFLYHEVDAEIDFQRDTGGRIIALNLYQNGATTQFVRRGIQGPVPSPPPQPFPALIPLDAATLAQYPGTYAGSGLLFTVTVKDGHFFAQLAGQPAIEAFPTAKDEFTPKAVHAKLVFKRDPSGKVTGLELHQNGAILPAQKQP